MKIGDYVRIKLVSGQRNVTGRIEAITEETFYHFPYTVRAHIYDNKYTFHFRLNELTKLTDVEVLELKLKGLC